MKQKITKYTSLLVLFALLSMTFVPTWVQAATTAVPGLSKIRVGLFVSGRDLTPSVALNAGTEMSVGYRTPAGNTEWFKTTGKFEIGLNQFFVQAGPYATQQLAAAAAAKIAIATGVVREKIIVEQMFRNSKQYVLQVGPFATQALAIAASPGFASALGVSATLLKVVGQQYWNTGSYPTAAEADAQLTSLQAVGLEAYKVYTETTTGPAIQVWLGPALDAAGLTAIQATALSALPTLQLTPIDATKAYLIEKTDVTAGTIAPVKRYFLNPNGSKASISSATNLSVAERYNRSYRGIFEITGYKDNLAVINELEFEQYLYSVVTSEMGGSFPLEALKAQAVAARTYAIAQGMKYGIAHITDTVYDQAYKGAGTEHALCVQAVKETTGEVMMSAGKIAVPYYSSNMGGYTADNSEVWKGSVTYIKSVASPDQIAETTKALWYRVVLPSGIIGYIRSDLVKDTGNKTAGGLAIYTAIGNATNVRSAPSTNDTLAPAIGKANIGDQLVVVEQRREWNAYSWVTAPMSGEQLQTLLNSKLVTKYASAITSLQVTKVGPSGRAVEVTANGKVIPVSYPDAYRSMLGGLWSTRFEVDNTASYTILGADGKTTTYPNNNQPLYALNAASPTTPKVIDTAFFAMNDNNTPRYMTIKPSFRFVGYGYGHGLGMSQWGAKDLADFMGYNYKQILGYYFQNITIDKGSM